MSAMSTDDDAALVAELRPIVEQITRTGSLMNDDVLVLMHQAPRLLRLADEALAGREVVQAAEALIDGGVVDQDALWEVLTEAVAVWQHREKPDDKV